MAVKNQDDQHEHTFSSYVRIQDVVLKTCLGRWTIGRSGERGSGISVLPARHDDIYIYIYIYICVCVCVCVCVCDYFVLPLSISFFTHHFYTNKINSENIFQFLLSIMLWLHEDIGFLYRVISWNKCMITKWRWAISVMIRVFDNGPGDRVSTHGPVIPKTQKWYLLNTQHYKVSIKGKVKHCREWSYVLPYTSVL